MLRLIGLPTLVVGFVFILASNTVGQNATLAAGLPACKSASHLYGTIISVGGNKVLVRGLKGTGLVDLVMVHATIRPYRATPRSGEYVRAYGCYVEDQNDKKVFETTYLTLGRNLAEVSLATSKPVTRRAPPAEATSSATWPSAGITSLPNRNTTGGQECSGFRWAQKIAADSDASSISATPRDTTIAALKAVKFSSEPTGARESPAETTVYRLRNVSLLRMYVEHDRDYHLIVSDQTGNQITLESPDPNCATESSLISQISSVRATLEKGQPSQGSILSAEGVGFYDGPGSGGMELHPLVAICFGSNCSL